MSEFSYNGHDFIMDGKPYPVLSGAMHYFRIPREYWIDRLTKLKECGFNTVETYTCWNLHEPKEGQFCFEGMLDLPAYVQIAADLGLNVILRPGPYICAEWEFGGFPGWLMNYDKIQLRCNDPLYLSKVERYLKELLGRLENHWAGNGGNIIMCQIENEYGSFGDDKDYLRAIAKIYHDCGVNCQLYTSDGACNWMLSGGTLDEYICVANFGSGAKGQFEALNRFRPGQPTMCGEFWCGWFDHWYEQHHTRPASEIAQQFTEITDAHASVNFYMFHGGTNFNFWNGANFHADYQPTITSYDYCALLSEAGDRTEAYYAVRELIEKHYGHSVPLTASESVKAAYGKISLNEQAFLLDQRDKLGTAVRRAKPVFMEDLGQNFGYILYSSTINGPIEELPLVLDVMRDRALVYLDGKLAGKEEWTHSKDLPSLKLDKGESVKVDILVENMGRVNYGVMVGLDRKGMSGVRLGQRWHYGWDIIPMEMNDLSGLDYASWTACGDQPQFLRGILTVDEPHDTFLRLDGFQKGFVTVNGFNIGRYFNTAGPQKTLYVPAPFLKAGENEIVVFESDGTETNVIEFTDTPEL